MQDDTLFANIKNSHSAAVTLDRLEKTVLAQNTLLSELTTWIQQLNDKIQGDVIESGGVKNVNINYFDSRNNPAPLQTETGTIPPALTEPQARTMHKNLVRAGLIDKSWQPQNLSGTQSSLLAKVLGDRLGITDVWQTFGQLWNRKPESLRRSFYKALDQKKSLAFQDKLKQILG